MTDYGTPQNPQIPPPQIEGPVVTVPLGLNARTPPVSLPAGVGPSLTNWVATGQGLQPRSGLSVMGPSGKSSANSWLNNSPVYGMGEYVSVQNQAIPVAISGTTLIWHNGSYWVGASWISSGGSVAGGYLPSVISTAFSPMALIYEPVNDNNALVFSQAVVNQRAYLFPGHQASSGGTQFSTLTNSPYAAVAVTYFDTRVVFGNTVDPSTNIRIPQRLEWSARGDPQLYTEPDGGAEDLVSMQGAITYLADDGDRLIVVSEEELWAGYKAPFPFDLQFAPLDRTVGCPHPYTVQKTVNGLMFLGHDQNVYLLPKGSGQPVPVGTPIWNQLRRGTVVAKVSASAFTGAASTFTADSSFAVYDALRGSYNLFVQGPTENFPTKGFTYSLADQTWSAFSCPHGLSRGVALDSSLQGSLYPGVYVGTSNGSVFVLPSLEHNVPVFGGGVALQSNVTQDAGSAFSAQALYPIGNPDPTRKLFVRDLFLDFSNDTAPSGSRLTIALSADFGQSYDKSVGVNLPFTLYSRQTVIHLDYAAIYPSIELQYESQVSGGCVRVQRLSAAVEGLGNPGVGG